MCSRNLNICVYVLTQLKHLCYVLTHSECLHYLLTQCNVCVMCSCKLNVCLGGDIKKKIHIAKCSIKGLTPPLPWANSVFSKTGTFFKAQKVI